MKKVGVGLTIKVDVMNGERLCIGRSTALERHHRVMQLTTHYEVPGFVSRARRMLETQPGHIISSSKSHDLNPATKTNQNAPYLAWQYSPKTPCLALPCRVRPIS